MQCPNCKNITLSATKIESDLPVYSCNSCEGALISLLYYRDWAERTHFDESENNSSAAKNVNIEESHSALNCPKCRKLMTKYSISGVSKNKLDLCASCDEVWLDHGEWELLKSLNLCTNISSVFTIEWQRKIRKEISETKLKERFRKILGDEDIEKYDAIRQELKNHKLRADILFFLSQQ